ncbi:hypothetical protein RHSIM_Rhsim09G0023400 [Rhododendron simsii]|uniref:Retrotransposon gag domain-containing protein n=1 Tax=Rhododendron simsii TaxID=118357 RepID=A0A834GE26_RHOSS|nr:hypothetical protein RHSIM_Rhsim09G0023400 [Rhododendron simsii]
MVDNRDRQWESSMKVKIPEFHGGLTPEEFVDWVAIVNETLELKEVPEVKRVPLVATRLRGRAAAWWQQNKLTRSRQGKEKIGSWDKMEKHGARSVADYTLEFDQFMVRNNLAETQEQMLCKSTNVGEEVQPKEYKGQLKRTQSFNCSSKSCNRKGDRPRKVLFVENDEFIAEENGGSEQVVEYDTSEEKLTGDIGPLLVL